MIFFGHLGITLLIVFVIFTLLKQNIDYRFVLVGAVLPDIIDKPIGDYLLYSVFQNGRIFAHTLLFIAVLTLVGLWVEKKYRTNVVEILAMGAVFHLAEDQLWLNPGTLFWPMLGWEFPKLYLEDYAGHIWDTLLHNPQAYVPEIIGITIIIGFIAYFRLYKVENLKAFLKSGKLEVKPVGGVPAAD